MNMKLVSSLFLLLLAITFTNLSCHKTCEGISEREDISLSQAYKDSICHFSQGAQWVFKSNTGDDDTAILGNVTYLFSRGDCIMSGRRGDDCCGRKWYEDAQQSLSFSGNDGLDKLKEIGLSNSTYRVNQITVTFNFQVPDTGQPVQISVDGVLLKDVYIWNYFTNNNFPNKVYWSVSKGLVKYEYLLQNNSTIVYERTDL